ncbi:proton-translocating transhydrogenase family protein [Sphingobium mellinum]|uniref:proton-translocating transhydrogenase family protein n=1 Tax=Sphingobium mellinum TaxID=1387166 RepID=UPI0030ECEA69
MNAFLVIAFALACIVGGRAAWRVPRADAPALATILFLLAAAIVAGTVSVAAEAGSAAARYLGLIAVLLASAALSGAFFAGRRTDAGRKADRP